MTKTPFPGHDLDPLNPEQRQAVREIARDEAERTLTERTIPEYPAYFVNGHWLVTYERAAHLANLAEKRAIDTATWQIKQSFPRWLRWLIR